MIVGSERQERVLKNQGHAYGCSGMQWVQMFASRTGWLETKYTKLHPGEFYAAGMDKLPRIPFDREQEIIDLANQMAAAQHASGLRKEIFTKIPKKEIDYFSVNVEV